jgi:soluble lytic murein transglycosylase-like protein
MTARNRRPNTRARCLAATCLWLAGTVVGAEESRGSGKVASFGDGTSAPVYKVFTYRQANGVPVFTDKVPSNQSYQVMEFSCFACNPRSTINWSATRLFTDEYAANIEEAAKLYGVDPALVRAVIHAESGFNPRARSNKGAMGLMQLMPGTASDMGVSNPWEAPQNIHGGVKYLAYLLQEFKGDVTLATAAYNAGPKSVERYRGIPPFEETQVYVRRVKVLHERYRNAG